MKLKTNVEVTDFLTAVSATKGGVWLVSPYGDRYNLKSTLSQYIAMGELLKAGGDLLEVFCDNKEDERLFFQFFREHPEVL